MNPFHKGKYISKVLSCNTWKGFKRSLTKLKHYSKLKSNGINLSLVAQFEILEMYNVSSEVVELCWLISYLNQGIGIFFLKSIEKVPFSVYIVLK